MAETNPVDRHARKADMRAQFDPVGDEVGTSCRPEHDVGQPLTAEAEVGDMITRRDKPFGEVTIDIVACDRLALRPQYEKREHDQRREHEQDGPPALAAPYRFRL